VEAPRERLDSTDGPLDRHSGGSARIEMSAPRRVCRGPKHRAGPPGSGAVMTLAHSDPSRPVRLHLRSDFELGYDDERVSVMQKAQRLSAGMAPGRRAGVAQLCRVLTTVEDS
jgi:hypothetical protein